MRDDVITVVKKLQLLLISFITSYFFSRNRYTSNKVADYN
jgi:hypothetical protein